MRMLIITALGSASLAIGAAGNAAAADAKVDALLKQHNCIQCHGMDKKILGPAYKDVAGKYKGQKDAAALLAKKVKEGGKGVWGQIPMPPNDKVSDADIQLMMAYILSM